MRKKKPTARSTAQQSPATDYPAADNLAIRCAAGAMAALGPEKVMELLEMPDADLGRLLKQAVVRLTCEIDRSNPEN